MWCVCVCVCKNMRVYDSDLVIFTTVKVHLLN